MLARWIGYCSSDRSRKILDADFEVMPEVAGEVRQKVVNGLSETEAKNFSDFLLGIV